MAGKFEGDIYQNGMSGLLPHPIIPEDQADKTIKRLQRITHKLLSKHYHSNFKDIVSDRDTLSDVSSQIYDIVGERDKYKDKLYDAIINRIDENTTDQDLDNIVVQERTNLVSDIVTEAMERSDFSEIYPMLSSIESKLISNFLVVNGPMKDAIDSFNVFLDEEIPEQINNFPFRIGYNNIDDITPDNSKSIRFNWEGYLPMNGDPTPEECRRRGLTYTVRVMCSIRAHSVEIGEDGEEIFTPSESNGEVFCLFDLPILLGCNKCHLGRAVVPDFNFGEELSKSDQDQIQYSCYPPTSQRAIDLREDPRDPFGYFIFNGRERSKIYKEMFRKGKIFTKMTPKGEFLSTLYTVIPTDCKRLMLRSKSNGNPIVDLVLNKFGTGQDDQYRGVNILVIVDIMDNMFLSRRMTKSGMGQEDSVGGVSHAFTELVRKYSGDNWSHMFTSWTLTTQEYSSQQIVADSFEDIFKDSNVKNIIKWLRKSRQWNTKKNPAKDPTTELTNYQKEVALQELFRDGLLASKHVYTQQNFIPEIERKIEMLAMLTARFLETMIGKRPLDDLNRWSVKSLESASAALSTALNLGMRTIVRNLSDATNLRENLVPSLKGSEGRDKINKEFEKVLKDPGVGEGDGIKSHHTTQIVERDNIINVYEKLLKIIATFNNKDKNMDKRQVKELGYICPTTTPTNDKCGSTKRKAITTYITHSNSFQTHISMMREVQFKIDGLGVHISDISQPSRDVEFEDGEYYLLVDKQDEEHPHYVLHDGHIIGWSHVDILDIYLKDLRYRGNLSAAKPSLIKRNFYYEISTFKGRLTRPLLSIVKDGPDKGKVRYTLLSDEDKEMSFNELISKGIIQYIDVEEQNEFVLASSIERVNSSLRLRVSRAEEERNLLDELDILKLEKSSSELAPSTIEDLFSDKFLNGEKIDKEIERVKNDIYIMDYKIRISKYYDYCELNPSAIFGPSASLIIYAAYVQGARLVGGSKMNTQAIAQSYTNPNKFVSGYFTLFPHKASVGTSSDRAFGIEDIPLGGTLTMAFYSDPRTAEDAFVFSEDLAEKLQFYKIKIKEFKVELSDKLEKPEYKSKRGKDKYRFIGKNGLPFIGAHVEPGDVVLGVSVDPGTHIANTKISEGEGGIIEDIIIEEDDVGGRIIKIKIRSHKMPRKATKVSARSSAQKGTGAVVVPTYEMPYIEGSDKRIDIIINPHNIPSRMTMGYLMETLTGLSSEILGARFDGLVFEKVDYNLLTKLLHYYGYSVYGKKMRNPITGHLSKVEIYTGPVLFQVLRHLAEEKIYSIGTGHSMGKGGGIHPETKCVKPGRSLGKASRVDYMGKDAIYGHGASHTVQERTCNQSDAYDTVFCNTCGVRAMARRVDENNTILECLRCGISKTPEDNINIDGTSLFSSTFIPYNTIRNEELWAAMGVLTVYDIRTLVDKLTEERQLY